MVSDRNIYGDSSNRQDNGEDAVDAANEEYGSDVDVDEQFQSFRISPSHD